MSEFDIFDEFNYLFTKIPRELRPTIDLMKNDGCIFVKIEGNSIFFDVPKSFSEEKLKHCARIMKLSTLKLKVKRI